MTTKCKPAVERNTIARQCLDNTFVLNFHIPNVLFWPIVRGRAGHRASGASRQAARSVSLPGTTQSTKPRRPKRGVPASSIALRLELKLHIGQTNQFQQGRRTGLHRSRDQQKSERFRQAPPYRLLDLKGIFYYSNRTASHMVLSWFLICRWRHAHLSKYQPMPRQFFEHERM